MRPYEVMVILEPSLEESQVQQVINQSTEQLQAAGSAVNQVDKWGKRRFAYELRKRQEGHYVLMEVSSEPAAVEELDRTLRLADDVLRHKVVRIPDRVVGKPQRKVSAEAIASATADDSRKERRNG